MKLLLPLLFIIAAFCGVYFYVNPEYARVKMLQEERDQYQAAVIDAQDATKKLNDLVAEWNSYSEEDLDRLARLLPENTDAVRMLIDVQAVAKQFNVTMENLQLRGQASGGTSGSSASSRSAAGPVAFGFSFSVNTTYENFQNFLAQLERSLQLVNVETLALPQADDKLPTRTYQISFSTYSMKR